jgi:hypothetical protein
MNAYYIGILVILIVVIITLLIISPTQSSFYEFEKLYPILYNNIHKNEDRYRNIIQEIINVTKIHHIDYTPTINNNINLEWINYSAKDYDYVRGKVEILPMYYNNKYYDNYKYFPLLLQALLQQPNILNVFFWKFSHTSGLLQHNTKKNNEVNIHDYNIINLPILRYTLAINVLSCVEEECSLWVDGQLKKLVFNEFLLWNPNKEFSLHNDSSTDDDVLFLNIDLDASHIL